jgi:hypothetical protein
MFDLYSFKESCLQEMQALMKRHPKMSYKQATKLLYQPGNMTIVYDKNNFDYE